MFKKIELKCSCCGAIFKGSQHILRDIGYGTCLDCCDWISNKWPKGSFMYSEPTNNEYNQLNIMK